MPRESGTNKPQTGDLKGSLSLKAYSYVRERILRGKLPPGTALPRRRLAVELEMSPLPVRDALQRLEAEGLVESLPRIGTRVKVPTPLDVRGHYVVREALETQAARLFAAKASREERQEIKRMAAALDKMYNTCPTSSGDRLEDHWYQLHVRHCRFHMRIAECSGFPALCAAMEQNQVLTFNWFYDTASGPNVSPPGWHAKLAKSLSQTNEETAAKAMRAHVRYGLDEIIARLDSIG